MNSTMRLLIMLLAGLSLCCATPKTRGPDAKERAIRLNAEKSRARELMDTGDYASALAVLKPLSGEASSDHQVLVMLGEAHGELGRLDEAVQDYEAAIRLAYSDYEPHAGLAKLLMKNGKIGRALTEFELAARLGPRVAVNHYNYGLALYELGRKTKAVEQWRIAHEMEDTKAAYAEAVGIGLSGSDDAAAAKFFGKAEALGADTHSFHNNYGLALDRAGKPAAAGDHFRRAVMLDPDNESYAFNRAVHHMNASSFEEAAGAWADLARRYGAKWKYLAYGARANLELERFEAAVSLAQQALGRPPAGPAEPPPHQVHATLAMSYRGIGAGEKALRHIRRAVELAPGEVPHLNNYGVILAENGSLTEAKAQWRRVLDIDPDNATARQNLSSFQP